MEKDFFWKESQKLPEQKNAIKNLKTKVNQLIADLEGEKASGAARRLEHQQALESLASQKEEGLERVDKLQAELKEKKKECEELVAANGVVALSVAEEKRGTQVRLALPLPFAIIISHFLPLSFLFLKVFLFSLPNNFPQ
jgi:hypothetical protein